MNFTLTGFDNKGGIQQYRLDYGNGITKDQDGNTFQQTYTSSGTFTARGYIKDSEGNWQGGSGSCQQIVYVNTKPLQSQPKTGASTELTLAALGSGTLGIIFLKLKKTLLLKMKK